MDATNGSGRGGQACRIFFHPEHADRQAFAFLTTPSARQPAGCRAATPPQEEGTRSIEKFLGGIYYSPSEEPMKNFSALVASACLLVATTITLAAPPDQRLIEAAKKSDAKTVRSLIAARVAYGAPRF